MSSPYNKTYLDQAELEKTVELVRAARRGESRALDVVYQRYLPRLCRWASGRIPAGARQAQDTGDVVHDVLYHFITKLDDFEPRHDGALITYLRMAFMNRIRDLARQVKRRGYLDDVDDYEVAGSGPSPFEMCFGAEVRDAYEKGLLALNEEERCAVILKLELDFGPTQIAEAMGKPTPAAAGVFTRRAIEKLAHIMSNDI